MAEQSGKITTESVRVTGIVIARGAMNSSAQNGSREHKRAVALAPLTGQSL